MLNNPLTHVLKGGARLAPGRRVYVVGDVHGHREKLAAVHTRIQADLRRRPIASPILVHLGDLIDRGPDSAGCIALLAAGPPIPDVPTINLMGNHEWMMLHALVGDAEDAENWLDNGGVATLASWGLKSTTRPNDWLGAIPPRHLIFLRDLRKTHVLDDYLFVHAGIRPGTPLAQQRDTDLLWIREPFLKWDGVMLPEAPARIVVHGHTPTPEPVLKPNRIGLDTGAGKGRALTCAILEAETVDLFQIE